MANLSNYPPGSNTSDAPWNQPEADPNDCEVCGRREGELTHPELGLICYECWPKCWICGEIAVWDSDGPCCVRHEREAMEEESGNA